MMNFTPRGRAKLADDQFVGDEWKVIEDVALEVFRIFRIVVVGVFAHDDIRIPHGVPDEARLRKSLHGVRVGRVGPVHRGVLLVHGFGVSASE